MYTHPSVCVYLCTRLCLFFAFVTTPPLLHDSIYTTRVLVVFDIYYRRKVYVKSFKTWTHHFVSPLRIFVSAQVIITSITALGMFTNRCYLSSSSVAAYRLACSEIPLLINEKKLERSPENGRSDDQIGRWWDSFSSATCFVL